MVNLKQLHKYIVEPTLAKIGMNSPAACVLVIGTGLYESGFYHFDQVDAPRPERPGPAYGPYQMEKPTHEDLWNNYLHHRSFRIPDFMALSIGVPSAEQMQGNWYYATAMCRLAYFRQKFVMPAPFHFEGLAAIYKKYYNTPLGKAVEAEAAKAFKKVYKELTA